MYLINLIISSVTSRIIIIYHRKALRKQKKVIKELKEMFTISSIFEVESTTSVVMVSKTFISNIKWQ